MEVYLEGLPKGFGKNHLRRKFLEFYEEKPRSINYLENSHYQVSVSEPLFLNILKGKKTFKIKNTIYPIEVKTGTNSQICLKKLQRLFPCEPLKAIPSKNTTLFYMKSLGDKQTLLRQGVVTYRSNSGASYDFEFKDPKTKINNNEFNVKVLIPFLLEYRKANRKKNINSKFISWLCNTYSLNKNYIKLNKKVKKEIIVLDSSIFQQLCELKETFYERIKVEFVKKLNPYEFVGKDVVLGKEEIKINKKMSGKVKMKKGVEKKKENYMFDPNINEDFLMNKIEEKIDAKSKKVKKSESKNFVIEDFLETPKKVPKTPPSKIIISEKQQIQVNPIKYTPLFKSGTNSPVPRNEKVVQKFHNFFTKEYKSILPLFDQKNNTHVNLIEIMSLSLEYPHEFYIVFNKNYRINFSEYIEYIRVRGSSKGNNPFGEVLRKYLIFLITQTYNIIQIGYYYSRNKDKSSIKHVNPEFVKKEDLNVKLYNESEIKNLLKVKPRFSETKCYVVCKDPIGVGSALKNKRKMNPALLVDANRKNPCGFFKEGSFGREEDLARRSNYCMFLWDNKKIKYPIKDDFFLLYSENVVFFRASSSYGYRFLERSIVMSIIGCPVDVKDFFASKISDEKKKKYEDRLRMRIEDIIRVAMSNKHDCLILTDIGCDGIFSAEYYNLLAKTFYNAISKYVGFFLEVVICVEASKMFHIQPYDVFKKYFGDEKNPLIIKREVKKKKKKSPKKKEEVNIDFDQNWGKLFTEIL